jgi:lipopolysaccharide assembly protein A
MRLALPLLALLCAVLGVLFGALNPQAVHVDLYWMTLDVRLGVALLAAIFAGALLGGFAVIVGMVLPLQRRLRKLRRDRAQLPAPAPIESGALVPSSSSRS